MKNNRTTQFPAPFLYKRADPDIFANESTILPSKKQSEISVWRENKSFEIRKAANTKSPKAPDVQIPPPNESVRDRLIRNKIKDINRLITMVKSRYSKESFTSSVYNSTTLQNPSVLKDEGTKTKYQKSNRKLKKKNSDVNDLDIVLHSYKPVLNPSMNDNPLRKRFNHSIERAYRQVVSNFFRL
jgi:hypothetical protein